MRALLIPLLIPLLILASYLGWSWYQIKYAMDELIKNAQPFAAITYQSIPLAYKGKYSVQGVKIDILHSGLVTEIDEVQLNTSDWHIMALKGTFLASDELPNQMTLDVTGLRYDSEMVADNNPMIGIMLEQPVMQGCNKANGEPVVMRDLQMGTLVSDFQLAYSLNPQSKIMNLLLEASTTGMGSLSFTADLEVASEKLSQSSAQASPPKLLALTAEYLDQGYNQHLVSYCAQQASLSVGEFYQSLIDDTKTQAESMGIVVPQQLLEIYPEVLKPGATYKAAVDFKQALSLESGQANVDISQLLTNVDVNISVNNKLIEMADLTNLLASITKQGGDIAGGSGLSGALGSMPESSMENGALFGSESNGDISGIDLLTDRSQKSVDVAPAQIVEDSYTTVKPKESEYKSISIASLAQSDIGNNIKVRTLNGRIIEGEILSVLNNRIVIRQKIGSGVADIPLLFKNLSAAQIKRQ